MAGDSPIQFKGTTLKIIQVQLGTADCAALHAALEDLTGNTPDFFEGELAVLDFSGAGDLPQDIDWPRLRDLFASSGLQVAAVAGLAEPFSAMATAAGVQVASIEALGRGTKREPRAKEPEVPPPVPPTVVVPPVPRTVLIDKPLRSGQRFYAQGADVIVTAVVSAGAEVIAGGNIHIYAPLRGRALAGADGDRQARIYATSLEAELVSIAGIYRTFDAGVPPALLRQPAVVSLREEGDDLRLDVAPLQLR